MTSNAIRFGGTDDGWEELDDVAFLGAIEFSDGASKSLKQAARDGDVSNFVELLRDEWRAEIATGDGEFRAGWVPSDDSQRFGDLIRIGADLASATGKRARRPSGKRDAIDIEEGRVRPLKGDPGPLASWVAAAAFGEPATVAETVALTEVLAEFGGVLSLGEFWSVWRTLLTAANRLVGSVAGPEDLAADEYIVRAGELPWAIGLLFGTVKGAAGLRKRGAKVLRSDVRDRTDTDGTPAGDACPQLAFWLSSLVRSAALSETLGEEPFDDAALDRMHDLLGITAAWTHRDGSLALTVDATVDVRPMLAAGLQLTGWKAKTAPRRLIEASLARGRNGKSSKGAKHTESNGRTRASDPEPATQSDWARVACLRTDWAGEADAIVVRYEQSQPFLDLAVFGHPVLAGEWSLSVSLDGEPLVFEPQCWECVCWFSDGEVDYLELQHTFDDDTRLERQLLLPRSEQCAMLADSITAPAGVRIDYESRIPLAGGITAVADTETRECILSAKRQVARVFPLGLPQERVTSAAGWFGPDEDGLRLEQAALGGLFAPVVLDWSLERTKTAADWRTLTVTEAGEILRNGAAHGHRVRIGKHQLLLYRSLDKGATARSVLGHHTAHETVIGRFGKSGEVEPLLLVE